MKVIYSENSLFSKGEEIDKETIEARAFDCLSSSTVGEAFTEALGTVIFENEFGAKYRLTRGVSWKRIPPQKN